MNRFLFPSQTKPGKSVLFAGAIDVQDYVPPVVGLIFRDDYAFKFTMKKHEREVRRAVSLHDYDLIILYVNNIVYEGDREIRFERALRLIRDLKQSVTTPIVVMSLYYTPGFETAAEQAGVEVIMEMPFEFQVFREQFRWVLDKPNNARN